MTKAKALTEEQWLTCEEPYRLLRYLRQHRRISRVKGTLRRARLFACACYRRAWHLLDEGQRVIVELVEQAADGEAKRQRLGEAGEEAEASRARIDAQIKATSYPTRELHLQQMLASTIAGLATNSLFFIAENSAAVIEVLLAYRNNPEGKAVLQQARRLAGAHHAVLLRDVFRNPFRPIPALDPTWLTWNNGMVKMMARAIYDERRWEDLPILADALEEAGCTDADLLGHCRSGKAHARGCWAVDLLLGVT